MRVVMTPHPDMSGGAIHSIAVEVTRPRADTIDLRYAAEGDMTRVRIPARSEPARRDELWRHTCFEAFLRPPAGEAYAEFNFSPSGEYAAYSFTAYRDGMQVVHGAAPEISVESSAARLGLHATIRTQDIQAVDLMGAVRLGLTAVIEDMDGAKSYWALAHPQGKPDFHHRDGFALDLPTLEQT
ncbi:MAG: hypothetical protein GC155_14665 [Alphaproteobacteria bacterium]|nr:hypothetical protein [Alphaproteobacteria bacterium]